MSRKNFSLTNWEISVRVSSLLRSYMMLGRNERLRIHKFGLRLVYINNLKIRNYGAEIFQAVCVYILRRNKAFV